MYLHFTLQAIHSHLLHLLLSCCHVIMFFFIHAAPLDEFFCDKRQWCEGCTAKAIIVKTNLIFFFCWFKTFLYQEINLLKQCPNPSYSWAWLKTTICKNIFRNVVSFLFFCMLYWYLFKQGLGDMFKINIMKWIRISFQYSNGKITNNIITLMQWIVCHSIALHQTNVICNQYLVWFVPICKPCKYYFGQLHFFKW